MYPTNLNNVILLNNTHYFDLIGVLYNMSNKIIGIAVCLQLIRGVQSEAASQLTDAYTLRCVWQH